MVFTQPALKSGELDRLLAVFRANPKSTVFVALAQGYLASGRATEAIEVLTQGLATYPDHADARLALARGYVLLHGWKEAENELVKVVKLDRYNQQGFSLLGEILIRRGNYDVAGKALQRAQDLDPTDDHTARLLERARIRRALDPPPPIPGETQPLVELASPSQLADLPSALALGSSAPEPVPEPANEFHDEGPTVVSLEPVGDATADVATEVVSMDVVDAALATEADVMSSAQAAPLAIVPAQPAPEPPRRPRRHSVTGRRVRRHSEEAAHPLVRSAEDYLNAALGADRLLHPEKDITAGDGPIERWGHRVDHPFVWMWLALGAAVLGGAVWYLGGLYARNAAVARHLAAARADLVEMSAASLDAADGEATQAIARNPASVAAVATLANARAFALLVYGDGQMADVEAAIAAAKQRVKAESGEGGEQQLALARAAYTLAALNRGLDAMNELAKVRPELDRALVTWPDEPLLYWLSGLARLATGDRAGARLALKQAATLGLGMARVALADMDLDEGAPATALAGYEEVLAKAPKASLALAGRALARADTAADLAATLRELEPTLTHVDGKRAEAWARLALSTLAGRTGDGDRARAELDAAVATGTAEPRFLARAALAQIATGRIDDAFTTRTRVRARSADPLLPTVDAELLLAGGRPDEALKAIGGAEDGRGKLIRGRALYDAGRAADAVLQLQDAAAKAPGSLEIKAWLELARLAELALAAGKPADAEGAARTALAAAPGYLPAHSVLGRSLVAAGKQSDAGPELQLVVDAGRASGGDELAYAEAALAMGQPDSAKAAVKRAQEKGAPEAQLARVSALVEPAPSERPVPKRKRR